jgi:hypothetical protein
MAAETKSSLGITAAVNRMAAASTILAEVSARVRVIRRSLPHVRQFAKVTPMQGRSQAKTEPEEPGIKRAGG